MKNNSIRAAVAVASGRRFLSDTGAFAEWVASSAATGRGDDLCLGFNAGGGGGGGGGSGAGGGLVWAGASPSTAVATAGGGRQAINYGIPADMGMVVLASAASFHQQQHHHESLLSSASAEHPVVPLLAAAPCLADDDGLAARPKPGGIHPWQPAQPQSPPYHHHHHLPPSHTANPNPNASPSLSNYLRKPVPMLDSSIILAGGGAAAGGGAMTCQDCGNQAKKDCSHRRCRTCCKSRGFECSTHVKSTWVPAARRRERQLTAASVAAAGSSASTSTPKKPRLVSSQPTTASHTSTSNTTPRSFDTTSSHQDASARESLPGHVRAPAVFKCVRVTSIDDGEDEYAYHAMVKIGGRIFKGFLHDHGLDDGSHDDGATKETIPNISELHLGNRNVGASSSSPVLPSEAFRGSGGLIGSTNYGNQIN
ncbi:hypothetical protein Cni_G02241 [Canna indica]|uniref:Uncharacterized protein n=1 Tax=Canna indica TaxID=4628 RepID=A0AAQ3JPQ3_9LILI|nr:hypothetical protein Cni_G02241 [Canna indica]